MVLIKRPPAWTPNTGKGFFLPRKAGLAALIRLSTSAVMKIVLPARESPVTPKRTCGPVVHSMRACAAARASNKRSAISDKTNRLSSAFRGGRGQGNGREKRVRQGNHEC